MKGSDAACKPASDPIYANPEYKNSIISFWVISEARRKNYEREKKEHVIIQMNKSMAFEVVNFVAATRPMG